MFKLFSKDIGIDLGTANTLVYVKGRGIIINEPSVVAFNQKTGQILAIGSEAKRMVGRTPAHIIASRPLVQGVISDFEVTEQMLRYFINKVQQGNLSFFSRPRVVVGIPSGVTEVERKAVEDATRSAGAKEVYLIEAQKGEKVISPPRFGHISINPAKRKTLITQKSFIMSFYFKTIGINCNT